MAGFDDMFLKEDKGKPRPSLLPANALLYMAEIMTKCANGRSDRNWALCDDPLRYDDALSRHHLKHKAGEVYDESGYAHLGLVATNAIIRLALWLEREQRELEQEKGDR